MVLFLIYIIIYQAKLMESKNNNIIFGFINWFSRLSMLYFLQIRSPVVNPISQEVSIQILQQYF